VPVSYRIFAADGLVVSRAAGVFTAREMTAHARVLAGDPRHHREFQQLYDLTDVTEVRVSQEEVQGFEYRNMPFDPAARRAFLATSDLVFGMARMILARAGVTDEQGIVVRTLPEACAFLGRPRCTAYLELVRAAPDWSTTLPHHGAGAAGQSAGASPVDRGTIPVRDAPEAAVRDRNVRRGGPEHEAHG